MIPLSNPMRMTMYNERIVEIPDGRVVLPEFFSVGDIFYGQWFGVNQSDNYWHGPYCVKSFFRDGQKGRMTCSVVEDNEVGPVMNELTGQSDLCVMSYPIRRVKFMTPFMIEYDPKQQRDEEDDI
jgi:hypothetical protein